MGGSSFLRRDQGRRNIISERMAIARRLTSPHVTFAEISRLAEERTGYSITVNALIKVELGLRPVYDYEVAAIGAALQIRTEFLLGLIDEPESLAVPNSERSDEWVHQQSD